ncbi:MAG TPA: hypothetical protein PKA32_03830, partial [Candidatus Gracilibacteria bacterium]|nr:hypothetical protein [Candidatus Gracilibacteria bacterium]
MTRRTSDRPPISFSSGVMRLTIVVGLTLSSARARAEPPENKCPQKLLADGRVAREGTCHAKIVFDSGVFNLYLEDGSIIIDDE